MRKRASECVPRAPHDGQVPGLDHGVDYREAKKLSEVGPPGGLLALQASSLRSRPVIDTTILVVVVACFSIAAVRIVLVAATVPYAMYLSRAQESGGPADDKTIAERVAGSGPFKSWWNDRRVPYQEGGDYLGVLSHHSAARTLGSAIGVLVEQARDNGVVIERVILPSDRTALYGEESGTPVIRADGTEYRTYWAPPANDVARFSDVAVTERDYDPVLSAGQAAALEAQTYLAEEANAVFVGAPRPGSSGTWIVYVREGERREFLLVPVELGPAGDAL